MPGIGERLGKAYTCLLSERLGKAGMSGMGNRRNIRGRPKTRLIDSILSSVKKKLEQSPGAIKDHDV